MRERVGTGSAADPGRGPLAEGTPAIRATALRKVYRGGGGTELTVLDGVDLHVAPGEAVAIIGASGAGKSTLLHLLGGLDRPTAGEVVVAGRPLGRLAGPELAAFRNEVIGFVFQFHHLLREFTAEENVMMPLLIGGADLEGARTRAHELLGEVGLTARASHRPTELSGGEQQRVAVARALARNPAVVLADEPSGNLDTHTSERLHELFFRLRSEHGVALVLATHNRELADRTDRVLRVKDGRLESLYPD
ncbi:MAG: ATP-binding cassette domain-containing protein [Gemmatimonadetes bacterium]|nr:ABC transporter ATP-binding protein [Gemmatimonadota bacterium]NIQ54280.1 ABC transporter ATP-binding protein [Gemmatimonadota bacterium]NIU74493.1 ATP-binding cassette domain-containing protein [Gammaproteobacteria bacterium]NIX44449.1 ATP-binding cassette domain-containing protein [Gemmatimonadota bacterium]NIY08674.1 ATP-binding cassette domain-containing protein [Gemmatimonadota bacterium]